MMDSFEDSVDGGSAGVKVLQNNGPWGSPSCNSVAQTDTFF